MAIEVGTKLEGKVTGITNFGAFVQLPEGVTGLVHISEIADNYVKDVNDHLKVEDVITVKVINVDKDGKIGLSIRKAVDKPERPERPERPARPDRAERPNRPQSRMPARNDRRSHGLSFEDKMSRFLKDSEERMTSIKKNTESKRGGKGAKRF